MQLFYQKDIKDYITRLKQPTIHPQDIYFGFERNWRPSLIFVAPVLTLSHRGNIIIPLHQDMLPKLKIMGTFLKIMRGAPIEAGWIDIYSLETFSGVKAMQHLVSLFTAETPARSLLITEIEYHQLEVGTEQIFLSSLCPRLQNLSTSTWFTNLWEFLHLCHLEICLPNLKLTSSKCSNDITIVDALILLGRREDKLRAVDQVQIYLQL